MRNEEEEERHESYGMIQVVRTTGTTRLFGSEVQHPHTFSLTISEGRRIIDPTGERFYADLRDQLIAIRMSPAQFVEMITASGLNSGIPCTVTRFNGEARERPPEGVRGEMDVVVDKTTERAEERLRGVYEAQAGIEEILNKKSITKKDREAIRAHLHLALKIVNDEVPFGTTMLREAKERLVARAKIEMDAAVTGALQRLGLEALHKRLGSVQEEQEETVAARLFEGGDS